MSLLKYIEAKKIRAFSKQIPKRTDVAGDDWPTGSTHWMVSLCRGEPGVDYGEMRLFYSMGSAHRDPPTAEMILESLILDSEEVQYSRSFEDWARNLGFCQDSRRAKRIYDAVVKKHEELLEFLGSKNEIEKALRAIQEEEEI